MSERNRQRLKWTVTGVLIALIALAVGIFAWPWGNGRSVDKSDRQTSERGPSDPGLRAGVQQVRRELALTNQDMAAMGLTQEQARSALNALVEWYTRNRSSIEDRRAREREAEHNLASAMRRFHAGPRDEAVVASLPSHRQAVNEVRAARRATLEQAAAAVSGTLIGDQPSLWATARSNVDHPQPLRFVPNLTEAQVDQWRQAMAKADRRGESVAAVEARVLTVSQVSAITACRERTRGSEDGVFVAERTVLPPDATEATGPRPRSPETP